jgi:hypothetical protein
VSTPLDIIEGKRLLISEEIARCYDVEVRVGKLNSLLLEGEIDMQEFRQRKIELLRTFDQNTLKLYKKLFAIEQGK